MWQYLYFVTHIFKKETTEYTGIEDYVSQMILREDVTWVPQQHALCFQRSMIKDNELMSHEETLMMKYLEREVEVMKKNLTAMVKNDADQMKRQLLVFYENVMQELSLISGSN